MNLTRVKKKKKENKSLLKNQFEKLKFNKLNNEKLSMTIVGWLIASFNGLPLVNTKIADFVFV